MNLKVVDNNFFYVKINKAYKSIDLNNPDEIIKKILILIRKKYSYNIFGFYEVKIYNLKDLITILSFSKKKEESFYNNVDLKINKEINYLDIKIDDFLIQEKYNKNKNIYGICEHYYFDESNLQC